MQLFYSLLFKIDLFANVVVIAIKLHCL